MKIVKGYSYKEEVGNSVTHFLGAGMAITTLPIFMIKASIIQNRRGLYILGTIIFSLSLILMFSLSASYHIVKTKAAKRVLKVFDHSAIFLLISGTYAAFVFCKIRTFESYIILSVQWFLTFLGIFFKARFAGRFKIVSTIIYLIMGWMVVLIFKDFVSSVSNVSFYLMLASGLTYSVGTIFYLIKSVSYMHMIWHLFVLGGGILSFLAVYYS